MSLDSVLDWFPSRNRLYEFGPPNDLRMQPAMREAVPERFPIRLSQEANSSLTTPFTLDGNFGSSLFERTPQAPAVKYCPMEHAFNCPYCGEEISMVLDLSVRRQSYVEDCEVCCNPIEVSYSVQDEALASFDAKILE